MTPAGKWTAVARVAKLFGRDGELSLILFDTFPGEYTLSEPLFVEIDGLAVPLFFEQFNRRGVNGATVRFADIDTQRRAAELVGHELYLADSFPDEEEELDEDEIYLEDLVGYEARFDSHRGPIEEFVDGENPLFRLSIDGQEVWVPAVDEFIVEIDTQAHTVSFDLPEGLLELYLG